MPASRLCRSAGCWSATHPASMSQPRFSAPTWMRSPPRFSAGSSRAGAWKLHQAFHRRSSPRRQSAPALSEIGPSLAVPRAERRPCSPNKGAIDNGLPIPARHGRNERVMALTRKNALFAGSDGGAEHWTIVMTLLTTAKLNHVEPFAWLTDVLQRVVSGRTRRHQIEQLLPWNWRPPGATQLAQAA
jgi:hypothetical protein